MKGNRILIGMILALVLIAAASIFVNSRTHAQEQNPDQAAVLAKLDQVLNNEKTIMDQIESMKQEVNIIKIRVTQSQ